MVPLSLLSMIVNYKWHLSYIDSKVELPIDSVPAVSITSCSKVKYTRQFVTSFPSPNTPR